MPHSEMQAVTLPFRLNPTNSPLIPTIFKDPTKHRGEIRWYTFAPPDTRRPVLLLTREPMIHRLNEVTVASVTTLIRNLDSEVRLPTADGMPTDCVVNFDQIQTLPRHKIGDAVTKLSQAKLEEVECALLYALGFRPFK